LNRYVAIAEEYPNDPSGKVKAGGLMHNRRVSRIVSPGTLIDESFMDPFTNNYVLAINVQITPPELAAAVNVQAESHHSLRLAEQLALTIGLAWLDLSTGHFFTQSTHLSALPSFLARVAPREIVLDRDLQSSKDHALFSVLREDRHLITYMGALTSKPIAEWAPMLESSVSAQMASDFTSEEIAAGSVLLQYVETRLQCSNMKLQPPSRQLDVVGIDRNTMRALEIKRTITDHRFAGSLLHTVRRTVTKSGARLLESWLSTSTPEQPRSKQSKRELT
jgi:DNA mismatch repair ATPase MutS